jgi:ribosomal protein S18 acetylase RimI-like enzyme
MKNITNLQAIFSPLDVARKKHMQGRDYTYITIVGVSPEYQNHGYGGKLIRAVLEQSDEKGQPVYLETTTDKNVSMYERFGFKKLEQVMQPIIDIPQWCMIREPRRSHER